MSLKQKALNRDQSKEKIGKSKMRMKNMSKQSMKWMIAVSNINPKYTPAITIVELCDVAEIGVGADVAFNNQEEKGNWADLERYTNKKDNDTMALKNISKGAVEEKRWGGRWRDVNEELILEAVIKENWKESYLHATI